VHALLQQQLANGVVFGCADILVMRCVGRLELVVAGRHKVVDKTANSLHRRRSLNIYARRHMLALPHPALCTPTIRSTSTV